MDKENNNSKELVKNNTNPKDIYNQNKKNIQDVKNIQERMASSQARNINKPSSINKLDNNLEGNNKNEEEITNNDNPNESEDQNKRETLNKASKQGVGLRRIASSLIGGEAKGKIAGATEIVLGPIKRLILMGSITFIALFTVILFAASVLITHSEKNREYTKSTVKKYSGVTNDNDEYRISNKRLNKELTDFDSDSDDPDDFFEENLKEDLIKYLNNNGYCGKTNCEKSDAYAFFKRLTIHVLENEQDGKSIDVGLLYETMAYYRADDELFQGSVTNSKDLKWWQVILNLFKKKTDEMDTLTDKMFKNKQIDLNQFAAYLLYGDKNNSGFNGYIDIGDATNMAEAMIATAYSKLGLGEPCGDNCNEITQHYNRVGDPWCAMFVSWVIENTEYDGKKLSSIINKSSAASWDFSNYFHHENPNLKWYYNDYCSSYAGKNGSGHYQPKMGDIFILNWDGNWPSGWSSHIGIVVSSEGHIMKTIEGNDGDVVKEDTRDLTGCNISGFGSWY